MALKLNGKRVYCPASYEELKTRHYQRIVTEWQPEEKDLYKKDFFKLFCILTDQEYSSFEKTPENEAAIWKSVRWFVEQPFKFEDKPPLMFNLGSKWLVLPRWIRVPKSTQSLSIGQNIVLRQAIERSQYLEENISFATAVFLQPIYDGKALDMERVKDLENIILEMPIAKVYPVGFFLLTRVARDGMKHSKIYSRTKSNPITRSANWLQGLLRSAGFQNGRITT